MSVDPDTDVCVTCGSTEAMIAAMLGLLDPGDEVVVFEPYYENYGPDAILSGAVPRMVTLRPPDWTFGEEELRAAFNDRTRAIVVNSPNNPTGKVFSREELSAIAELCVRYDVIAITDEIYEHITYDGTRHVPIATIPGMEDRTVTISALSKTYSVTGWRVGWAVAAPALMDGIRPVHDFLTVAAAAPLQIAGITALGLADDYYSTTLAEYAERRAAMMRILDETGFVAQAPAGAYYVMADISHLGFDDDVTAATSLVEKIGVATVPGSSFFSDPVNGRHLLRFAFCKKLETLEAAGERLRSLA
jgi:aminotransferase